MRKIMKPVYWVVVGLRLVTPPLFFFSPSILLVVIIVLLDAFDIEFASAADLTESQYQQWDKMLDLYWYVWILVYILFYYPSLGFFLGVLFLYRLIGQIWYFYAKNRRVFFFFPNFFEYVFFLFFAAKTIPSLSWLVREENLFYSLVSIFLFKMLHEYLVHIKQLTFHTNVLGLERHWKRA